MNGSLKLIVARKESLVNPDSGIVQIVLTLDDEGQTALAREVDFPSRTVWISKGYEDIKQRFQEGELFLIDHYYETEKEFDYNDTQKPGSRCDHWATGNAAKKIETGKLVPVIDALLPDRATGILNYNGIIPSGQFFIRAQSNIFGPFIASRSEDEIQVTPQQCMPLGLHANHIIKLSDKALKDSEIYFPITVSEPGLAGYISSLKEISEKLSDSIERIDFISDAQLINYFAKNGYGSTKNPLGRKPAEQLKNVISNEAKRKLVHAENERLERLTEILDKYLTHPDPGFQIIDSWLATKDGKAFLKELLLQNPEIASSHTAELGFQKGQIEAEIDSLKMEKRKLESEVLAEKNKVTKARESAEADIAEIRKQTLQEQQAERQKLMADLEEKIQEKNNTLQDINTNLQVAIKKLNNVESVEDLQKEIDYRQRSLDDLKSAVRTQERLLKSPELPEDMIKTQALLDLIQGRRLNQKNQPINYVKSRIASRIPEDGETVIQALADHFEEGGRSFTFEEMANLVITIQQSFMTVLKGLPGAGKTSTAIRLAQAHHLADATGRGDNFLNVPVSRGWVSGRDFIGFFNAFKGSYQPAKTGMYQFLRNASEQGADETLRLVLLDEANLSPMEHYLSDFLGLFDIEGRHRPLDTGMLDEEQRFLTVPPNIRFIATVNNDSTTEPLSPRLCDRVPVISMDVSESDSSQIRSSLQLDGAIPYRSLESLFGVHSKLADSDVYDDEIPAKAGAALPLFEEKGKEYGQAMVVSKRKRMAMQAYCMVACRFMDESKAADFALSQYVLPLINGFGKPYRMRLEKILEHTQRNNLNRTAELLEAIISTGDAHVESYSFF